MATDFLTKWINFWVFLFSVTVLSYSGHGGQSAIVLMLTMLFVTIVKRKESTEFILNKKKKYFCIWCLYFGFYNCLAFSTNLKVMNLKMPGRN